MTNAHTNQGNSLRKQLVHMPKPKTDRQTEFWTHQLWVHRRRYRLWVTRTSSVSPPAQPNPHLTDRHNTESDSIKGVGRGRCPQIGRGGGKRVASALESGQLTFFK